MFTTGKNTNHNWQAKPNS